MKQLARNESFVDLVVEKKKNAHAYFELCGIHNFSWNFLKLNSHSDNWTKEPIN